MITVTPNAIQQILASADRGDMQGMALRLAARFAEDGSIEYAMGFDDRSAQDTVVTVDGVELLIHENHRELLNGATLDFVEIAPGRSGFVFRDPEPSGCGSCGGNGGNRGGSGCSSSGGCS